MLRLRKGLSERRDFIMRAIVFEIEKFATHDGPGIRTVVETSGYAPQTAIESVPFFRMSRVYRVARGSEFL